jgi:hypothetical protein
VSSGGDSWRLEKGLALQVGLEPTTLRLTVASRGYSAKSYRFTWSREVLAFSRDWHRSRVSRFRTVSSLNATDVDHPRRTIRHRVGSSGPLPRGERDPVSPRTARTPLDRPGNGQLALRRGRRRLAGSHSARIRGRDRRSTAPSRYRSFRWQPLAGRSRYPRFHGAPDPVSRTVSPEGGDDVRLRHGHPLSSRAA